jgi:predicted small lipoprotein YifL
MLKNMRVLVIFAAYFALMGCGTKGPLYIPEQRYPQGAENNHAPKDVKQPSLQANIHAPFTQNNQLQLVYYAGTTLAVARSYI